MNKFTGITTGTRYIVYTSPFSLLNPSDKQVSDYWDNYWSKTSNKGWYLLYWRNDHKKESAKKDIFLRYVGSLLRENILFTCDTLVKPFFLHDSVNLLIFDRIKNKTIRILPLYFVLNDALRIFKKIYINKLFYVKYFSLKKRDYLKSLPLSKGSLYIIFMFFVKILLPNGIMHSLGNIRKVSGQLVAFLLKFVINLIKYF